MMASLKEGKMDAKLAMISSFWRRAQSRRSARKPVHTVRPANSMMVHTVMRAKPAQSE